MHENPQIPETKALLNWLKIAGPSVVSQENNADYSKATVHSIRSLYCNAKLSTSTVIGCCFVSVSFIDLLSEITYLGCASCRKKIDSNTMCQKKGCPRSLPVKLFKLKLSVMDQTGSLDNIMAFGSTAEQLLGVNAKLFEQMEEHSKLVLQYSLLWKRVKIFLKVNDTLQFSVIGFSELNYTEAITEMGNLSINKL